MFFFFIPFTPALNWLMISKEQNSIQCNLVSSHCVCRGAGLTLFQWISFLHSKDSKGTAEGLFICDLYSHFASVHQLSKENMESKNKIAMTFEA